MAESISAITVRRSAVASIAPSRCDCSVLPSALTSVIAMPSASSGFAPAPRTEKSPSRSGQKVRERLEGSHNALARQRGGREPCDDDDHAEGPAHLDPVLTGPEPHERDDHAREPAGKHDEGKAGLERETR